MIKNLSRNARKILVSFFFAGFVISNNLIAADGKTVFKQNCAVCHTLTNQRTTGPGLGGIKDRAPGGDWLFNWVKNAERMIKSGDAEANKIFKEYAPTVMTVFEGTLSDEDIKAVVEYIKNPPPTGPEI